MVNFGPLAAEIGFGNLGHPSYFQRLPRLGSVTAWQSTRERQPNFAALNRERHLCSAGRPSHWALAHISSFRYFTFHLMLLVGRICVCVPKKMFVFRLKVKVKLANQFQQRN